MSHWHPEIYAKAWAYASRQHHGQTYGGAQDGERIEYISHIASVAMEVTWALQADHTADSALAVQCALLHDTIEDTDSTFDTIKNLFGEGVADGVLALSKDESLPTKDAQMRDSLARIKQQPREVWMVKMADRISNLALPPYYWSNEKILAYRDEANIIYHELHTANSQLAQRLQQKIAAYPQFLR
jgi:(p)ppGpp synthase/HD superfamily hydrolase